MKNLLSKFLPKAAPAPPDTPRWSVTSVASVLKHFPVGGRVLYRPEAKRELRLESVILGCALNRHFVFSQAHLRFEHGNDGARVVVTGEDREEEFSGVHTFYLLIPFQARSEIDYDAQPPSEGRAQLVQKAVNDFSRDSVVTLISSNPYGRVPHIETSVRSVSVLSKGFYANQKVVVLDPFFNTLAEVDQRRHHRISTRIPLMLRTSAEGEPLSCTIEDFSERFLRVKIEGEATSQEAFSVGRKVSLTLDPSERGQPFTLQGTVFRKNRGSVVLELQSILKQGRFSEFHLIDQLTFKAALLDHPATQEALRKKKAAQ